MDCQNERSTSGNWRAASERSPLHPTERVVRNHKGTATGNRNRYALTKYCPDCAHGITPYPAHKKERPPLGVEAFLRNRSIVKNATLAPTSLPVVAEMQHRMKMPRRSGARELDGFDGSAYPAARSRLASQLNFTAGTSRNALPSSSADAPDDHRDLSRGRGESAPAKRIPKPDSHPHASATPSLRPVDHVQALLWLDSIGFAHRLYLRGVRMTQSNKGVALARIKKLE